MGGLEKVDVALNGYQALKRLQENEGLPDLIFLDLRMPGMSGFDFLQAIRNDERFWPIPIIVITSSSRQSNRQAVCETGADGFLYKTINFDHFCKSLSLELKNFLK